MHRLVDRSRMSGDVHVRFCEGLRGRFPRATRLLACFQYKDEAENFMTRLVDRLKGFHLEVAPDKTKILEFGRFARKNAKQKGQKPKEFTFLGFTHYCGKTKNGYFKVKRRTCRKKFGVSIANFTDWARKSSCVMTKGQMLRSARRRVVGYLNYYAITDNSEKCIAYLYHVTRILFKWLNRKSQRRSYTWKGYEQALRHVRWPKPRIRKDLNPFRRAEAI